MGRTNETERQTEKAGPANAQPRADRAETKSVTVHAHKVTADEFKILAIRNNVTSEALMHVGIAASFAMFGQSLPKPLQKKLRDVGLYERFRKFAHLQND